MINLAGNENANQFVKLELEEADVPIIITKFKKRFTPEVPSTMIGVLQFGDVVITFTRAWYYWVVHLTSPLPYDTANPLNDIAGAEIRAEGFAGGTSIDKDGCDSYHVDSQNGLNTLVKVLKNYFGEPMKNPTVTVEYLAKQNIVNSAIYG